MCLTQFNTESSKNDSHLFIKHHFKFRDNHIYDDELYLFNVSSIFDYLSILKNRLVINFKTFMFSTKNLFNEQENHDYILFLNLLVNYMSCAHNNSTYYEYELYQTYTDILNSKIDFEKRNIDILNFNNMNLNDINKKDFKHYVYIYSKLKYLLKYKIIGLSKKDRIINGLPDDYLYEYILIFINNLIQNSYENYGWIEEDQFIKNLKMIKNNIIKKIDNIDLSKVTGGLKLSDLKERKDIA